MRLRLARRRSASSRACTRLCASRHDRGSEPRPFRRAAETISARLCDRPMRIAAGGSEVTRRRRKNIGCRCRFRPRQIAAAVQESSSPCRGSALDDQEFHPPTEPESQQRNHLAEDHDAVARAVERRERAGVRPTAMPTRRQHQHRRRSPSPSASIVADPPHGLARAASRQRRQEIRDAPIQPRRRPDAPARRADEDANRRPAAAWHRPSSERLDDPGRGRASGCRPRTGALLKRQSGEPAPQRR